MKAPEHSLVIIREIDAPSRDVYAAWTQPDKMERWLGRVTRTVRVGSRYRFHLGGDDTASYSGEYLVLEEGRRVVQTICADNQYSAVPTPSPTELIEVQLRDLGPSRTELTFINGWDGGALDEKSLAEAKLAWSGWFDLMERSLVEGDRDADPGR